GSCFRDCTVKAKPKSCYKCKQEHICPLQLSRDCPDESGTAGTGFYSTASCPRGGAGAGTECYRCGKIGDIARARPNARRQLLRWGLHLGLRQQRRLRRRCKRQQDVLYVRRRGAFEPRLRAGQQVLQLRRRRPYQPRLHPGAEARVLYVPERGPYLARLLRRHRGLIPSLHMRCA
ncbi:hypothetical protein K438DRAFT_2044449, partial [Mycena galopus ATCC 62051]